MAIVAWSSGKKQECARAEEEVRRPCAFIVQNLRPFAITL